MKKTITGGCACGTVRYQLNSPPFDAGWCHCTICRHVSGAPAMVFATVPAADLIFTAGGDQVEVCRSSGFGRRRFCGACGSPLTMEVGHQPGTIDFPAATLDQPEAAAPGFHIFWSSRIGWFDPADGLPRHDRFRPDTRGLEGTEPPSS